MITPLQIGLAYGIIGAFSGAACLILPSMEDETASAKIPVAAAFALCWPLIAVTMGFGLFMNLRKG